jgi:nucleoside-diphosphate-sugar epimerase
VKKEEQSKVLIIGAEGYIGRSVYSRISKVHETITIDLNNYNDTNFPGFDVIINLAAHSSVALCQLFPESAMYNNLTRIERILRNLSSKQYLIHASSASVYGIGNFESRESDFLPHPSNLYDETKMAADKLISSAFHSGKKVASLRFGTVSGLSSTTRVDLVMNAMVLNAKTSGEISVINPEIRRNLLFIDDLVEAILRLISSNAFGIFNLGSQNLTIGSLANTISKMYPSELNISQNEVASPFDFHLDTSKIEEVIGNYRVTSLSKTISELWEGLNESSHSRANMHGPHPMLGMRFT